MSYKNSLLPLFLSCLSGSLLFPLSAKPQNYSSFEPKNISQFSTIAFPSQPLLLAQQVDNRQRVALVIGNAKYQYGTVLNNPVNDANDMAKKLKEIGFEVILVTDGNLKKMDQAVDQFYNQLNKGSVALFYYAGHGIQVDGENYLLPTDANLASQSDVKYQTLPISKVLDKMYEADSEVRIAILDACRDNPFARNWKTRSSSLTRGLAQVQSRGAGDFIAYATQPGNVSLDGNGRNGVFTQYLLKHLDHSGKNIEELFTLVRQDVAQNTKNEQVPFTTNGLIGNFYFAKATTSNVVINNRVNNQTEIKTNTNTNNNNISSNNNQNADFYLTRGNLAYDKREYKQAIADYNQALSLDPQLSEIYYKRGNIYADQQQYQQAIADYNQAISLNPQLFKAYYNRGNAYYTQKQYQQAIADYNQALKLNPQLAEAYYNRAIIYDDQGQVDQAIADYNQTLKLNPQFSPDAYYNRGFAYRNKGQYDQAITDYNQAIKLNPQHSLAYTERGFTYGIKGQLDQAIADYNQALKLNPQFPEAYVGRGFIYNIQGKLDQAIADYNQALKLKPKFPEAYVFRGFAYESKGEYNQAMQDYDQAIKLDPSNQTAIDSKRRLQGMLRHR